MKRLVLVIGRRGMLGQDIIKELEGKFEVSGVGSDRVDIRDIESVRRCVGEFAPGVVINAAAYTDVDGAESDATEAFAVNATGAKNVAVAAKETGANSVYFSSDYVFDGTKSRPYTEADETNPVGVYARSKREGELGVFEADPEALVIRAAWLYGPGGKNFVETVIRLSGEKDELTIVDDQRGSPTWTRHLARATVKLMEAGAEGIVHVTNSGDTTWRGFAKKIVEKLNLTARIKPITTREFGRPAPRPAYSVLDTSKYRRITGDEMPRWEDALDRYIEERNVL